MVERVVSLSKILSWTCAGRRVDLLAKFCDSGMVLRIGKRSDENGKTLMRALALEDGHGGAEDAEGVQVEGTMGHVVVL